MLQGDSILKCVARHKLIVFSCTALLGAAGVGVNTITPPTYEATARLEMAKPASRTAWTDQLVGASSAQVENLNLYTTSEMIKRRGLLVRLAEDLAHRGAWVADLAAPQAPGGGRFAWATAALAQFTQWTQNAQAAQAPGVRRPPTPGLDLAAMGPAVTDAYVLQLADMITVRPVRDTRLVDVVVDHTDPEVARTIADRLVQLFADDERERMCAADTAGLALLESQLAVADDRVRAHEAVAAQGATVDEVLQSRATRITQAMGELDDAARRAGDDRRDVEARLARLERYASAPDTTLWEPSGSEALDALHRDLLAAMRRLAAAAVLYKPMHPRYAALDSEVAALRAQERRELPALSGELRAQLVLLSARAARARAAMADSERALADMGARKVSTSLGGRTAMADADRELADRLRERIRDRLLAAPLEPSPVQIVDAAMVAPDPVRPRKALNVGVGLLSGMFLGLGIALVRRPPLAPVERPDELEERLDLPVLAVLPERAAEETQS